MALELVCGADFWCKRHCRTSPVVLEGFWGQVWPKIRRKQEKSEYRIANEPLSKAKNKHEHIFPPGSGPEPERGRARCKARRDRLLPKSKGNPRAARPPLVLAVLKAKMKITIFSESGRNRPKTYDSLRKMAVRTLPRDPPGQGEN